MLRRLLLPLAILAVSLHRDAAETQAPTAAPTFTGVSGPGFTIEVKQGGKDLKTLKAGTYTIKVQDKASIHNFHLIGPGVNKTTTRPASRATQTWTVTLKKGTYTYQCDPHASTGMKGTFKVT